MRRLVLSLFTAAVISSIIFVLLNDFGITWDEPIYMQRGDVYVKWLNHPTLTDIDKTFGATTDDVHPPFRKLVAGITHGILTTHLHLTDNTSGYRISSLFFVFPFIMVLTYIAIGQLGYAVGLLVPFMLTAIPQVLYLTPLVTLDYAIMCLWFIAVMAGIRGVKSYFWLTISGICVGLTMLTKLHGYLLFLPIFGCIVGNHQKDTVKKIVLITSVAFITYLAGWPWLWTSPIAHLTQYFHLQSTFENVPEYIFGKTYMAAPWWYVPVMFLVTTPAFVIILFFIGAGTVIRKGRFWDRFMLANALYPIAFFSLPWIYRHDWVRLFLPAYPFVCVVAGRGVVTIVQMFGKKFRFIVLVLILIAWVFTVYGSVIRIHPWESSYYNEFVGGVRGAARLGMETEFWGNAYLGVLPWMNDHKKDMMCVSPVTSPFYYYQAMGQIEPGVVFTAGREACIYLVVLMRQGLFVRDPYVENVVRTQKSVYNVTLDSVPMVSIYDIRNIKK